MRIAAVIAISALPLAAQAGPETWHAIKSTGGLEVGAPFHSAGGWLLRVRARLSDLPAPKTQKDAPDGGLSCSKTEAVVEGANIYLTIVSGNARGPVAAVCPAARLGEIEAGKYQVFYRGPGEPAVPLKDVEIGR